jgi:hypothetical protein
LEVVGRGGKLATTSSEYRRSWGGVVGGSVGEPPELWVGGGEVVKEAR